MNFLRPKNIFPTFYPIYLNKQLFTFNKKYTKLCSYCRLQVLTNPIFVKCKFAIKLWSDLKDCCQCSFDLLILNPQSANFGFFEIDPNLLIILNHILLLYKYYIYSPRAFICSPIGNFKK